MTTGGAQSNGKKYDNNDNIIQQNKSVSCPEIYGAQNEKYIGDFGKVL